MGKSFQQRLEAAKKAAGFTLTDLSQWFDGVNYQTISTWLNGRVPKAYRRVQVEAALSSLERAIKSKPSKLPMPLHVKEGERRAYVRSVREKYPAA